MSWMQRLYETYEQATQLDASEKRIAPIRHTVQNAHINIVLDENAQFVSAKVLKKFPVVLPATEDSATKTSTMIAPHALCDKLEYVAKDARLYWGQSEAYFDEYFKQLNQWCAHKAPMKVQIVKNYVEKGTVVADLIKAEIFCRDVGNDNRLKWQWDKEDKNRPEIFKSLTPVGKQSKLYTSQKDSFNIGSALVIWSVEIFGDFESQVWKDKKIQDSWINFCTSADEVTNQLCMVKGEFEEVSNKHPKLLGQAKIISSKNVGGLVYGGKFLSAIEAASISTDSSQKAHNALRWLIERQGIRNGDQVTVAWAVSGKEVPQPLAEPMSYDDDEPASQSEDLGLHVARKIKLKRHGYAQKLEGAEQLSLITLDSATPGRMSIGYYREFLPAEYFKNLDDWYEQFAWYQRITKEVPSVGKTKPDKKTIWPILPPTPEAIALAAYGPALNEKFKKQVYAKVLACIAEGDSFPLAFVEMAINRASSPMGYEVWEWERNVGVACALFKGFQERSQQRRYNVALDTECRSRDYLYGRLLAVAERLESVALNVAGEKRRTTAERYMQQFAARPFHTWRDIELALDPYKARLNNNGRVGFLVSREKELTDIQNLFDRTDFCSDSKLSGEFLLGYHCQKMIYRKSNAAVQDEPANSSDASSTSDEPTPQE